MKHFILSLLLLSVLALTSCSVLVKNNLSKLSQLTSNQSIAINQLGYLNQGDKFATIPNVTASRFDLIDAKTNKVVYTAQLSGVKIWALSGNDTFKLANFSEFVTSGHYFLRVNGVADSPLFSIGDNVYDSLSTAALKYYYLNRSGIDIEEKYAGIYARPMGHKDNNVGYHSSAEASDNYKAQRTKANKGWYDAGDYGKYVVNSGISTYTLLAAFEHYPDVYKKQNLNIPESEDSVPDILNEALWNLEWLISMQSDDGGVYHKLTTRDWPGYEMPHEDQRLRLMIGKSTAASLNFAATLSMASRVIAPYYPKKSEQYLKAAIKAWQWALENQTQYYEQPGDVKSGEYGDKYLKDEFAWAAAELFITTKDKGFYTIYKEININYVTPAWRNVATLSLSSLLFEAKELLTESEYSELKLKQKHLADMYLEQHKSSPYNVAMEKSDFVWGSNSVALNKAMVLLQAAQVNKNNEYKNAAHGLIDYVLGRNPTGYSFVTGFGTKTPLYPHHRISHRDGVVAPIPGMLVGGPHSGLQDNCNYSSNEPAKSYIDDWCSFSTNEVAINWNAPLVYVIAAFVSR
ncbi:glycoside hydrolase family 9 protein [Pseudoalteromonas sp. 10-33]|uniref:glycoside hydrolase family 9 protein n=1 Tax=Pseudoalteromonas sp. 10-33 TaxID=1761890 RepID=UPI00073228BE|nr:glycoside hydrolase family 9 protein [Pseudoalteromonas sp. 10-33]KTF08868.1 glycoside hydrolase family 9 [Pseudoalteromonas sp. 10-33]